MSSKRYAPSACERTHDAPNVSQGISSSIIRGPSSHALGVYIPVQRPRPQRAHRSPPLKQQGDGGKRRRSQEKRRRLIVCFKGSWPGVFVFAEMNPLPVPVPAPARVHLYTNCIPDCSLYDVRVPKRRSMPRTRGTCQVRVQACFFFFPLPNSRWRERRHHVYRAEDRRQCASTCVCVRACVLVHVCLKKIRFCCCAQGTLLSVRCLRVIFSSLPNDFSSCKFTSCFALRYWF